MYTVSRNDKWEFVSSTNSDTYTALAKVIPSDEVASEEYAYEIKLDEFTEGYTAGHYAILNYH